MSNRPLPLSQLCALVGDEHIECHPLADCLTGAKARKKGFTELTLSVFTQSVTPNNVLAMTAMTEGFDREGCPPVVGLVILIPHDRWKAAVKRHNEQPARQETT